MINFYMKVAKMDPRIEKKYIILFIVEELYMKS